MNILELADKVKIKANKIVKSENISYGKAYKIAYKKLKINWR